MKLVILSLFFPLFLLFCFMYSNNNLSHEGRESTEQTEQIGQTLVHQPFVVIGTIETISDLEEEGRYVGIVQATAKDHPFSSIFTIKIPKEKFQGKIKKLKRGDRIKFIFSSDRIIATKKMPPQISNDQLSKVIKID
ncbi:hypothetical protein [Enterococcus villorum]|uniref:Uncharacterized protein n=2 Tax=Enterococcus villorum TaxID=112904 RepID=A0A511IZ57_9ENTE|nr:hypothetical protein [Enterococcus villorum]EOH87393.1 hypothetical protein UAO_02104 [Enterococcus villorum ATCC 700913]EOW77888.1 hypothetical protein I591_00742 [Enterococcus villorum ATCC 700913]GEL91062.1 hypothetical protein EVI01_03990 [Enterococcus villorum]